MTKQIILFITVIFISSCSNNTYKEESNKPKIYHKNNAVIKNNICYELKTYNKCNGIYYRYYKSGHVYLELPIKNGLGHGIQKFYKKSGEIKYAGLYENGKNIKDLVGKKNTLVFKHTMKPGVTYKILPPKYHLPQDIE